MLGGLRRRRSRALESRLVWIFGSPRSGSTWLLQLLNDHERIRGLDEPLIGEHLAPILSDRPGFAAEDLSEADFTWYRMARDVEAYFFSQRHRSAWLPALGELLRARLGEHVEDSSLLAIKEPNGTQAADILLAALPSSRMIFLLRDGRDVVDSELAAFQRGSWMSRRYETMRGIDDSERARFVVQSAYKWLWRTQVCQEAVRSHPGPTHALRYEDLRADPSTELRGLFEWLEVATPDLDALAARFSFDRAGRRGPTEFHRTGSSGTWRENLTAAEQKELHRVLGPKLHELGYE